MNMKDRRTILHRLVRIQRLVEEGAAWALRHNRWETAATGRWSGSQRLLHVVLTLEHCADHFEQSPANSAARAPIIGPMQWLRRSSVFTLMRLPKAARVPDALWPSSSVPIQSDDVTRRAKAAVLRLATLAEDRWNLPRDVLWAEHRDLGPLSFEEWVQFLFVTAIHHDDRLHRGR